MWQANALLLLTREIFEISLNTASTTSWGIGLSINNGAPVASTTIPANIQTVYIHFDSAALTSYTYQTSSGYYVTLPIHPILLYANDIVQLLISPAPSASTITLTNEYDQFLHL